MSKAYSNKALPPGTVIREWRLEEVLGVGGFGIVYKGRGIYFNELVAIKEYFPSSISERDPDATVVPIDSDAEEVHALGLKKFVEEAKLLWNLSTPSRHPNIVNVRSLFEIHGTAYMVMDFEDGTSLSRLLKQGTRFNERSLLNLVRPIAEGLDRAHRVGVLHRDIKPPNILINEDSRPVLIDFGSARFEAAEATSTTVTFHTPPYAAIEQYVKTYAQGPWTDIYALGVVLYECVTGEKPPEVLERMHGGLGETLSAGKWPGYSQRFLAAVDAAMTIRPTERPQSIAEWLAMFDGTQGKKAHAVAVEMDDEATRVVPYNTAADEIVPVAPPAPGFSPDEPIETGVPADPSEARFKLAGRDSKAAQKAGSAAAVAAAAGAAAAEPAETAAVEEPGTNAPPAKPPATGKPSAKEAAGKRTKRVSPALAAAAALGLVVVVGGVWATLGGSEDAPAAEARGGTAAAAAQPVQAAVPNDVDGLLGAMRSLADDARAGGAPADGLDGLDTGIEQLTGIHRDLEAASADPSQAGARPQHEARFRQAAASAAGSFAAALLRKAEADAQRLAANVPWANPARPASARGLAPDQQEAASNLRSSLAALRSAAASSSKATDAGQAMAAARQTLDQSRTFAAAVSTAYAANTAAGEKDSAGTALAAAKTPAAPKPRQAASAATESKAKPTKGGETKVADTAASPAKIKQLRSIIDDGRGLAKQVIRMADRKRPGGNATAKQKEGYDIRQANAALARNYDAYMSQLKSAVPGVRTEAEAARLIKQSSQTRAYLQFLERRSKETLAW